jgi:hypothetical protein
MQRVCEVQNLKETSMAGTAKKKPAKKAAKKTTKKKAKKK